jgi:hypothetical protein
MGLGVRSSFELRTKNSNPLTPVWVVLYNHHQISMYEQVTSRNHIISQKLKGLSRIAWYTWTYLLPGDVPRFDRGQC